jgi:hypothetical protein
MQAGCKRRTLDCLLWPFRIRIARDAFVSLVIGADRPHGSNVSSAISKNARASFLARAQFLIFSFPTKLIPLRCQQLFFLGDL